MKINIYQNIYSKISILLVIIITMVVNFNYHYWDDYTSVIKWDTINYYQYLPAWFDYGDLKFNFIYHDWDLIKTKFWPISSPTGGFTNKVTMGMSILYAPFYLIAEIQAIITNKPTDGFSTPYMMWLIIGALTYVVIGFVYLRKTLLMFFSDLATSITILLLLFATNLFFYTTVDMAMPHAYLFSLFSLFIYFTIKWHKKASIKDSIILGLIVSIITLIRPTDIIIVLFFIFYNVLNSKTLINKYYFFIKRWQYLIIITLFTITFWIPQIIYWKYTTGSYLFFSYGNEGFFFNNPQIIKTLFSFRKGWFIYTPIMFFVVLSIFLLYKKQKQFFLPILLFVIINIYIISSWWCWWYGGTYGNRVFIESYALMAFPLATLMSLLINNRKIFFKFITFFFVILFITHQSFQLIKYNNKSIHYDSMSKKAYFSTFFDIKPPNNFDSMLEKANYKYCLLNNNYDTKPVEVSIKKVQFRTSNDKYLCSDMGIAGVLYANKNKAGSWETFYLIKYSDKTYSIKNSKDFFVTKTPDINILMANDDVNNSYCYFILEKVGENRVKIKTLNNLYFSVEKYTNQIFLTDNDKLLPEVFEIIYL